LSEETKIDNVTVTMMMMTMMMISKTTLIYVVHKNRSREIPLDKDKGNILEIIHVCSYSFGSRRVKPVEEA
jgi:hypothetical protein